MDDGERNGSDSDDGSSASWVILNDDDHISEGEDSLATAGVEPPAPAPAPAPAAADSQPPAPAMDSSGESAKTVVERTDVSAGAETSGAAPPATARVEEGSDIEVIPAEHTDDVFFEDDPMDLTVDVSEDSSSETVRVMGALPSETVLRQRRGRGAAAQDNAEDRGVDRDQTRDQTRDQEEDQREDQKEGPEAGALPHRSAVQPVPPDSDRDRWADDTDLSTLTDQMVLDEADAGRLRQYVHQRNNTVNHLLTVVLVLCVTCVLGLGVGHFLGWLHHHEMTEEIVHTLDEKLDVLRDDLMTCMTTEDDQDLDNKWIKELLTENEALLQQLHGEEEQSGAEGGSHCSEAGYARLRDQVNQLRMENDELKANIAKMRYGTTSQDGYVLRRHRDKINQLVTENGELARELRRTRYLQPPAGITDQEDDPAPSAGQLPTVTESERGTDSDSDSAGDSPEFLAPAAYQADSSDSADSAYSNDDSEASFTTFSDSDSDSADSDYGSAGSTSDSTDDDSSADEGLLAALLSWRPAPGSVPLQEARHRLWSLWQEASDFSRAEPASKYVQMAGKTLAKVEKTLLKAMHKVQQFGEDMMQDDDVGGGRMEKVAGKLGRKVGKVVAKLDARWQEIRRNWEGKVAAREAQTEQETKREPAGEPERPAGLPPNASDPSVAAYYARRSRHRQHARGEDAAGNWQMERGKSRAEIRGAFHGASWLLERAQARQQLRQRRGEEAPVPPVDQRWRQERAGRRGEEAPRTDGGWRHEQQQQQRHEWNAAEDDDDRDDDDDDDDDDYEDHAARLARHMAASARFHDRIQKTVHRHAAKIDRKVRENHWKHFGGRNRHEFRERGQKY